MTIDVFAPLVFWTLLLIPGFAVARRFVPDELEGGLLPGLAVSWVTALAVLAPLTVLGYLLHAPTWLATTALGGFIAWGGFELARRRAWRGAGRMLVASIGLELLVVAADAWFSVRHGSILAADARVHLARIRFLHDHGLSNLDPFIAVSYPYPIYHTNLHHALFAMGSRLMGVDPLHFWFGSLAAAKVMIASGLAYLAWAVCGGRWAAGVAAVMVLVDRGPHSYSIYPNQLAPWFLLPIFIGTMARTLGVAWREPDAAWWWRLPRLAAIALVVGMFHPLYAGFITVIASPILLGTAAWRLVRGRPSRAAAGTAAVAWVLVVLCAMPFPFAGKRMTVKDREQDADLAAIAAQVDAMDGEAGAEIDDRALGADERDRRAKGGSDSGALTRDAREEAIFKVPDGFMVTEWGETRWVSRQPGRGFTGAFARGWIKAWRPLLVLGSLGLVLWLARRREAWYLLASILVVQAVVLVPPVCTMALRFLGAHWMLQRFETTAFVMFHAASLPALAAALEAVLGGSRVRDWSTGRAWRRGIVTVLVRWRLAPTLLVLAAIPLAMAHATHRRPYDWSYYWNRITAPDDYRYGRELKGLEQLQALLRERVPPGSVIAVEPFTGTRLAMLHDISLVASERSSTGVKDGGRRRIDLDLMFSIDTEETDRAALFEKYGVTHYASRGDGRVWMDWWDAEVGRKSGYTVATLADEPDLTQLWRRRMKQGIRAMQAGRHEQAVEFLQEVVIEEPRLERAWFRLGLALLSQGDAVLAAEAFERAEQIDPEDARHPLMAGNALSSAERLPQALDAFERAVRVARAAGDDGQAATASFNLGNTWYLLDHPEDAIAAYERALEFDERYEKARQYLETVRGILEEERSDSVEEADQSETTDGRPARDEKNTPSARPNP